MAKKRISIKDVARQAKVSPATVSRVINKSDHPISDKTRAAVESAVEELRFQPNRMARGLITNKSDIIGVIIHDISDAYFAEITKGLEEALLDYEYIVNIYNTYRNIEKELRAVNMLKANGADAVVLAGGTLLDYHYKEKMKQYIAELKEQGSIVVGVTSHPFEIKNIKIGNEFVVKTIVDYLINKGHKDIAYIGGPEILSTAQNRLKGYKQALLERNMKIDEDLIISGDFTFMGGRKAALEVLEYMDKISAVIASNDDLALGLIWELKNRGVKVPDEISVVGIGNIPAAKYSYPPLTTISLPAYQLGVQIGKCIINSLHDKKSTDDEIEFEFSLVERDSVKDLSN